MEALRKFVAPEIVFGPGALSLAGRYAHNLGASKVFLVTDPGVAEAGWAQAVIRSLQAESLDFALYTDVSTNPRAEEVMVGAEHYARSACDVIVAVGGGSPMDCAKAIGVVHTNNRHVNDQHNAMPLPSGTERVLFVDDETMLADMSQQILQRLGYQVTACTSSVEALQHFQNDPSAFDLIITDMTMPHMTGKELATAILKINPELPIILCTGFSETISEEAAKHIDIQAFILKPIVMNELAETMRKVLDGPR